MDWDAGRQAGREKGRGGKQKGKGKGTTKNLHGDRSRHLLLLIVVTRKPLVQGLLLRRDILETPARFRVPLWLLAVSSCTETTHTRSDASILLLPSEASFVFRRFTLP